MADHSLIEWTDATWNPVTGCDKVSPGCKYCYAERMAKRLQGMGIHSYRNGFKLTLQPQVLTLPLTWRKPKIIFVNSMSDLFHPGIPSSYLQKVFDIMRRAYWHQFQVLTKRADYLAQTSTEIEWPNNVWMGVSVENQDYLWRIELLRETAAKIKFLSLEPLLGPLPHLDLREVDWVIVGGESGPKARSIKQSWVIDIRNQCVKANVPFFFKQWGGFNKKSNGRVLLGKTWDEMPKDVKRQSIQEKTQSIDNDEVLTIHFPTVSKLARY